MNTTKKTKGAIMAFAAVFATTALADSADPQVTNVQVAQDPSRAVTVTYRLDADAIVTMDVLTNGVSIGGQNISHVSGDCFKLVSAGQSKSFVWHPDKSWPNHKFSEPIVSVRVTAWAKDNPPDYMVVSIPSSDGVKETRYFQSKEFLPGGLLGNKEYRTSSIVMRRIHAAGKSWTMGSVAEVLRASQETSHPVCLDKDYYMGVFEVTQAQWALIAPGGDNALPQWPSNYADANTRGLHPVENIHYHYIRLNTAWAQDTSAYEYPQDPNPNSFIGLLNQRTGVKFDLPSEGQWEFACRSGNGEGYWNNGAVIDENTMPGHHNNNEPKGATAAVGSATPNDWGLYDMHGNVSEYCLDWYEADITAYEGALNAAAGMKTLGGTQKAWNNDRVSRGGNYQAPYHQCRSAYRYGLMGYQNVAYGFRLACSIVAE